MKGPQAPEGALLVLQIAEALSKLQGLRPRIGHLGNAASRIESRRAQGGKKPHLLASIRLGDGCQCSERLLDAAAAGTAIEVIQDEVLLARAKADHQARVSRNPYVCPLPGDLEPPVKMSA